MDLYSNLEEVGKVSRNLDSLYEVVVGWYLEDTDSDSLSEVVVGWH